MQFPTTAIFVAAFSAVLAAAAPAAAIEGTPITPEAIAKILVPQLAEGASLAKRTPGNVFICTDGNFSGQCTNLLTQANNGCTTLSEFWRTNISSFGPDSGTRCVIYTSNNCGSGGSTSFTTPGFSNLGGWNDNMGSYKCQW